MHRNWFNWARRMAGAPAQGKALSGRRAMRSIVALVTLLLALASLALRSPLGAAAGSPTNPIALNAADWSGSAGFGATAPAWFADTLGAVHLQGAAKQVSTSGDPTLIGTLPPAASPTFTIYTIVHTFNGTYADLSISPNGQIRVIAPRAPAVTDFSFVSLEGVSYLRFVGNAVTVNTSDWSASAGFGAVAPGWYLDGAGVMHLQGAAKQVSTGGDATLVGTVPIEEAPCATVYTIGHTFAGTYADLSIDQNGEIRVIAPRPPAVTDFSFVSLEGITWQPYEGCVVGWNTLPVNAADWSASAGFGSTAPAWKNIGGVVHLRGAAKRVSTSGDPNLVATLPAAASPSRTVYTIVHTFAGTYADLSIAPNGQIRVIGRRSPMVEDLSFLSLESITFQQ